MKFSTSTRDPQEDLWAEPAFVDAYLEMLGNEDRARGDVAADAPRPLGLRDELDEAASTMRRARALAADVDRRFRAVLAEAEADPEPWVGPDPTRDPLWEDPRRRSAATVRAHRRDLAVRAAAADLAVRVQLSDHQVRSRAHRAEVLAARCPKTWQAYLVGRVSEQNAATVAHLADSLPARATDAWAAFDDAIAGPAARTAPGRFRIRANALRERVHPESIDDRHARAAQDRAVHFVPEFDGMAHIDAYVPATQAHAIERRIEADARHLAGAPDETRTLAQLRTDVFCDLLTTAASEDGARSGIRATVNVTIPVLTLLGASDEPATLDGYGPIDLDTARQLAGNATHWIRVLTHPVSGTVLDVDRRAYRVSKALRRWLGIQHPTCIFPGCTRPAYRCDIDHRKRWADGGTTSADNLGPECEGHHPVKDETLWRLERDPKTGVLRWISPTGYIADTDPPPF